MRPLAVINGIILGTCSAIFIGLAVTVFIFYVLGNEDPALASEIPALQKSTLIFLGMTCVSTASFIGQLKSASWRWYAQATVIVGIAAVGWFYVP
ncbi:MAG: hypothetical protein MJA83_18055 [Gammaproteobacteria bacterium]|nr:hypothetical protein [Gammaproteobacteria bacterium]